MLRVLEPVVEPLPLDSHVEIGRGYEGLSHHGLQEAVLSQDHISPHLYIEEQLTMPALVLRRGYC